MWFNLIILVNYKVQLRSQHPIWDWRWKSSETASFPATFPVPFIWTLLVYYFVLFLLLKIMFLRSILSTVLFFFFTAKCIPTNKCSYTICVSVLLLIDIWVGCSVILGCFEFLWHPSPPTLGHCLRLLGVQEECLAYKSSSLGRIWRSHLGA